MRRALIAVFLIVPVVFTAAVLRADKRPEDALCNALTADLRALVAPDGADTRGGPTAPFAYGYCTAEVVQHQDARVQSPQRRVVSARVAAEPAAPADLLDRYRANLTQDADGASIKNAEVLGQGAFVFTTAHAKRDPNAGARQLDGRFPVVAYWQRDRAVISISTFIAGGSVREQQQLTLRLATRFSKRSNPILQSQTMVPTRRD